MHAAAMHRVARPPSPPPASLPHRWAAPGTRFAKYVTPNSRRQLMKVEERDLAEMGMKELLKTASSPPRSLRGGGTAPTAPPPRPQQLGVAPKQLGLAVGRSLQKVHATASQALGIMSALTISTFHPSTAPTATAPLTTIVPAAATSIGRNGDGSGSSSGLSMRATRATPTPAWATLGAELELPA
jgi:hypothetical protein